MVRDILHLDDKLLVHFHYSKRRIVRAYRCAVLLSRATGCGKENGSTNRLTITVFVFLCSN